VARNTAAWSTDVFGSGNVAADLRVQAIIAANLSDAARAAAAAPAPGHALLANAHLPGAGHTPGTARALN
jgi:hypothetical protein